MAAVLIHKGSAESKDSDDRMEPALKRIEDKLGTEPTSKRQANLIGQGDLHVIPDEMIRDARSTEPDGYYDTQQEAIEGARSWRARMD